MLRHPRVFRAISRFKRIRYKRLIFDGFIIFLILFVCANAITWLAYRTRTYPRTLVANQTIGSVHYKDIAASTERMHLVPSNIILKLSDQQISVNTRELGIVRDTAKTVASAKQERTFLPILNIFLQHHLAAPFAIDSSAFTKKATELGTTFHKDAVNAHLELQNGTVSIAAEQNGYELNAALLKQRVTEALNKGQSSVVVPTKTIKPAITAAQLQDDTQNLDRQLDTPITYTYNGTSKQPSRSDIAQWYEASGSNYVVTASRVISYVGQVGNNFNIRVDNTTQAADATIAALAKAQSATIALIAKQAHVTYTYCTAVKNIDTAELAILKAKLQSTYNDSKGWSIDGTIAFREGSSGCDFTVWLSAADLMPTFGAICDSMWSCRVGNNVVINYDRWQGASPAWNAAGGSLDNYRSMVINHETGHWFEFGHTYCSAAGQPAPVMQQQSIDLGGCTFNPWPTQAELASLRSSLGL